MPGPWVGSFGLRDPIPAALAAFTLPYLFDYTFTIDGGNLFSTLAGEYAYSLSVALALLFLGLLARGLRTGKGRTFTAIALACCILAHIVPAMFALVGAALLIAAELLPARWRLHDDGFGPRDGVSRAPGREGVRSSSQAVWWGVTTVALGGLLTSFWLIPFGLDQAYANSMGYSNVTTFEQLLLPGADWWALIVAAMAVGLAIARRSRFGLLVATMGGISALGLCFDPLASLYNTRLLPLWFLCVYLMAGWGMGVVCPWWPSGGTAIAWRAGSTPLGWRSIRGVGFADARVALVGLPVPWSGLWWPWPLSVPSSYRPSWSRRSHCRR